MESTVYDSMLSAILTETPLTSIQKNYIGKENITFLSTNDKEDYENKDNAKQNYYLKYDGRNTYSKESTNQKIDNKIEKEQRYDGNDVSEIDDSKIDDSKIDDNKNEDKENDSKESNDKETDDKENDDKETDDKENDDKENDDTENDENEDDESEGDDNENDDKDFSDLDVFSNNGKKASITLREFYEKDYSVENEEDDDESYELSESSDKHDDCYNLSSDSSVDSNFETDQQDCASNCDFTSNKNKKRKL